MMRMRTMNDSVRPPPVNGGSSREKEWELRPGGMLVQTRTETDQNRVPPPTIRVRVKYGSIYHEIRISSQATFGELKKMLSGPTGLHHQDQKLFFKDKERDSKAFLDTSGVKDKSKIVLQEDPISQEKRYLEMRKSAKMEKTAKSVSEISLEVDRLAGQVSALESVISKGAKVAEKDIVNLIELLMNQLLKLDGIIADGDVKLQRKMQVRRVQKLVETLDVLKIKNSVPHTSNGKDEPHKQRRFSNADVSSPVDSQGRVSFGHSLIDSPVEQQPARHSAGGSVVITTQWETFDSAVGGPSTSAGSTRVAQPSFPWDLL
ncbi:BAG family molecular chaperone regulator 2 [Striga asiatica]|uniref:BAG family molecular chaperone regulator 2 n=1 Tax=Striga asiatica TaxID=4170 RepID=A0A5A7PQU8_STRAF|nr:BAG family molecular chaperone regulator 2 [Striga asiatica]